MTAWQRLNARLGAETLPLVAFLIFVCAAFSLVTPLFLTGANLRSMAFQMPVLGLLTLAWTLIQFGGPEAGFGAFVLGAFLALVVGALSGAVIGAVVAYSGAHPILVSLAMMIFLRGLGEFLTRGGDISGFPEYMNTLGHGSLLGIPIPMYVFAAAAILWHVMLKRTRHGFSVYMIGSNIQASEYSGLHTRRTLVMIYVISGVICAVAGIMMAASFNSVRVGHGEAFLLVTVLACFLGGIDPFGGFGRVLPVVVALMILQALSSGLNLIGANQHLATAVWGLFLIAVMAIRYVALRWRSMHFKGK